MAVVARSSGGADVTQAKTALRSRIRETRAELDVRALVSAGRALCDVLLNTSEIATAGRVAAYVSVGPEPGTGQLLEALSDRGTDVLLPVLLPDLDLDWAPYTGPAGLVTATRGLLEPVGARLGTDAIASVDAVLVPGLAVDRDGVRLGQGGGCYDRALARVTGGSFTCVVLHDGEVLDMPLPRAPHDVPVMAAATPSGLHRLRSPRHL